MRFPSRLAAGLAATTLGALTLGAAGLAGVASAAPASTAGGGSHAVFVQNDRLAGNQVVAYRRGAGGRLTWAHTYATGGKGGQLAGSVVDHVASQGSLTYDPTDHLLLAVNAGSNTVTVFAVNGDKLSRRQVISSHGAFPVSVAVHGHLVDVLNAENGGSVQGYAVVSGRLAPLAGDHRALGLDPTATPQFVNTPGQVAFTPSGRQLVVTTKANGNDIDVLTVSRAGHLGARPVVNLETGTVPFAVTFNGARQLVVGEAGTDAVATFRLHADGKLSAVDTVATGEMATCWITSARGHFFASNAGSGAVSRFAATPAGRLTLLGTTATAAGTVDAAASSSQRYLYVQTGATGTVDEFRVGAAGTLTSIGSVVVPDAVGGEGIVAF
jgi:6-phosphogluconolactonase (cycloisomerase 2 family)